MKKFINPILYFLGILLISTFIITLFNYIGILSSLPLKISKITIPVIACFISGFITGKKSTKKGWLSGTQIGLIITLIMVILNLLLKNNFTIFNILYYVSLIIICVFGSIVGINKKTS